MELIFVENQTVISTFNSKECPFIKDDLIYLNNKNYKVIKREFENLLLTPVELEINLLSIYIHVEII
jgi:hypothetical protein